MPWLKSSPSELSHYPPLTGPDERMSWILKRMLQNPQLPRGAQDARRLARADARRMGQRRGHVSGRRATAPTLVGWLAKTRAALDAFRPDFVLMWGDDQYENFKEDVVPPYCISAYERFKFTAPPGNVWGETDKTFDLPGHPRGRQDAGHRLIEEGFDTAYAYKPLHHPLGHAFTNAVMYLDYDRKGFDYPIVPFAINCYGRQGAGPARRPAGVRPRDRRRRPRSAGADAQAAVRSRRGDGAHPRPVALSRGAARLLGLVACLPDRRRTTTSSPTRRPTGGCTTRCAPATGRPGATTRRAAVEDSGQQEILNWMCLAGAMSELKRKPQETGFVDTWIFNSSKAFLIAPPN